MTHNSWERPNWWGIVGLTAAGLLVTAVAGFLDSQYLQGVLVNIGSALLLFALLVFAEPWLVRSLRRPHTLAQAQDELRHYVEGGADWTDSVSVDTAVRRSVDRVRGNLKKAGLWQELPSGDQLTFVDRPRCRLKWTVDWSGQRLQHAIVIDGQQCGIWQSAFLADTVTDEVNRQLRQFDEQVYPLMCTAIDTLRRGKASKALIDA